MTETEEYLGIDFCVQMTEGMFSEIPGLITSIWCDRYARAVEKSLEEISDIHSISVPIRWRDGEVQEYKIYSIEGVNSYFRRSDDDILLCVLLAEEYLKRLYAIPHEDQDFFGHRDKQQELMEEVRGKSSKYFSLAKVHKLRFNGIGTAIIPDEVRKNLPA